MEKVKNEPSAGGYYWYKYRLRGFSPGCQPGGSQWYDESVGPFGAIAYERPLTEKEISEYELDPVQI